MFKNLTPRQIFLLAFILILILVLAISAAWYLKEKRNQIADRPLMQNTLTNTNQPRLIGGDKDAGGCLVGAGYSWCEAKKVCLRVWEEYCTAAAPKTAVFNCAKGKIITATFYPTDDKFVDLNLGEGRILSVPRAISASGARYAKADESFVFWNKGDTAFITENNVETFSDCVTKN